MTEEQKLQWLQGLIDKGVNVAQINLGDGYQTFHLGKDGDSQQVPNVVGADEVEDVTIQSSQRGPRKKSLFSKDGRDTNEDSMVRNREKERLCAYLSKHCLKNRKLVCTKEDTLNKTIVCFLLKWMERGLIAENPSGGAVFRFLTEDCGMVSEVQEKAYSNRIKEWIKDRNGYDTEVMLMVRGAFVKNN